MKNPKVPAFHFNTRFIVTSKSWFGGGMDMTPCIKDLNQKEISDEGWLQAYRIGLEVHSRDGKNTYFKTLNEAITEELAIRNLPKILGNPIFQKEKEKTNKLKNNPVLKSLGLVNKDTYYAGYTAMADFHYKKERELLNDTIDAFFEQNKEKFKDREEVFEVFAKAAITGNILPLGRLFDETFGKGSFRRYGNY
jgi:coproporphyrinogen III oxidase